MRIIGAFVFVLLTTGLQGCSDNQGFSDLEAFVAEVKARPKRPIEPLPQFQAYQAFSYSAASRRSPFAQPLEEVDVVQEDQDVNRNVRPDPDRPKELLEFYDLGSMAMVGTIVRNNDTTLYALVDDGVGGIHRVRTGQYIGRNHGKVLEVSPTGIQLIEIVSDGQGGYFERPRTLSLKEVQ